MTTRELLAACNPPGAWQQIKLRWLSRRYSGGTPDTKNPEYWEGGTVPWLNSGAVNQGTITTPSDYITELAVRESSAKWIPKGSLVMALAGQGKTKATVGFLDIETTGNQSLAAIVPQDIEGKYLYWWLSSQYITLRNLSSQDGRDGLNLEMIGSILCPVPPIDAQRRIANFLDEKTAQIDGLIEKKRVLLERLAEKRQALIIRAVTKGLDLNVPMKSSGIDGLGDVPAHWEAKRLNSFCDFVSGKAHEPFVDSNGEYVCVNARFISTNGLTEKRCTENLCPAKPGDILMVMSDLPNGRALARSFLVNDQVAYAVNQRVCRIRLHTGLSDYFSYQLNRNPQLLKYDDGKEQIHLSNLVFKHLLLLKPPEEEQRQIVIYLDQSVAALEKMEVRVGKTMALLKEYRSAIIAAAVTGKIEDLK